MVWVVVGKNGTGMDYEVIGKSGFSGYNVVSDKVVRNSDVVLMLQK